MDGIDGDIFWVIFVVGFWLFVVFFVVVLVVYVDDLWDWVWFWFFIIVVFWVIMGLGRRGGMIGFGGVRVVRVVVFVGFGRGVVIYVDVRVLFVVFVWWGRGFGVVRFKVGGGFVFRDVVLGFGLGFF